MTRPRSRKIPLGGCDCYLLALDDHMQRAGQGRHAGVTFLELGPGFSPIRLEQAAARFAAAHPLLGARLQRRLPGLLPRWITGTPARLDVTTHPPDTDPQALAESLLTGKWGGFLRFDILPAHDTTMLLMAWNHLLFDARGVELALAEVARLANANDTPPARESWGVYARPADGLHRKLQAVRPFVDRYYELKKRHAVSLAPPPAMAGNPHCRFLIFTAEETTAIGRRAQQLTGGIFLMPYYLAVAMRAHAAVLATRETPKTTALQCAIAAQGRKRGAADPVFQNQVTQLFFTLGLDQMNALPEAAQALQDQFTAMTKQKVDAAFLSMINWMRRLPASTYRRFLQRGADGNITSFYHAHTGTFLPRTPTFCDAPILNGWHAPSVSQPPGTGIFFSECRGRLTMSFSWREGAITTNEIALVFDRVRADLLGAEPDAYSTPSPTM